MLEPIALAAACAASLGYFTYRLWRRLGAMHAATPNLSFDRLGERLWRVAAEVLLQRRVLRQRPLAGFLHALVMWGFFAFAWVSVTHLAQGFRGLESAAADTSWYGAFAAGWAAAVLAGIGGLAFRRFVLRPRYLGGFSAGSVLVTALIVVLMVTYLADWRGFAPGSTEWQLNWWAHTAAFLAMLWVIPNSKHLHLVVAPAAIFFRTGETTSPTRALREEDDDDFGMLRFSDLTQKDILDVNSCVECGRCTEVCPANLTGGSLDPKKIILQMQHGLTAGGNLAERSVAGTQDEIARGEAWVAEADLYQCLTCGACEEACPVGIEHVGAKIVDLRRGLVSEGRARGEKLAAIFRAMERAPHNAWGAPQETRRKLIETAEFPVFDGSQEWLLWLGCGCNYDPHGAKVARSMKTIFDAAGVSWGVLERETCCGEPARRAGNEYLYMELSEKVIDALAESGARNVVTCDPHCCRMLDADYRQNPRYAELDVRVTHHSELLEQILPRVPLRAEEVATTYHDPCYLARGRGVTEMPRIVLEAVGARLTEMPRHGTNGFCCGAGGAQLYLADDQQAADAARVNHVRFEEAAATGAAAIAVACPYCHIMLSDAAGHAGRNDVRIVDVAELIASRIPR